MEHLVCTTSALLTTTMAREGPVEGAACIAVEPAQGAAPRTSFMQFDCRDTLSVTGGGIKRSAVSGEAGGSRHARIRPPGFDCAFRVRSTLVRENR